MPPLIVYVDQFYTLITRQQSLKFLHARSANLLAKTNGHGVFALFTLLGESRIVYTFFNHMKIPRSMCKGKGKEKKMVFKAQKGKNKARVVVLLQLSTHHGKSGIMKYLCSPQSSIYCCHIHLSNNSKVVYSDKNIVLCKINFCIHISIQYFPSLYYIAVLFLCVFFF